ncbi:MAG: c-type cytochrome [Candidatus Eiseniibacteriota bacterium]
MQRRFTLQTIAITGTLLATLGAVRAFSQTAAPAAGSVTVAKGPSKGDAKAGEVVFKAKSCATCHKADGSGGVKLTGNATPNLRDPKVWADPKRKDDWYFRDCITNGKPASGMVPWGKSGQIKPADIENLIAYLHTFKPKAK